MQATLPAGTSAGPIAKALGKMWNSMTAEERQPYIAAKQAEDAVLQKVGDGVCAQDALVFEQTYAPAEAAIGAPEIRRCRRWAFPRAQKKRWSHRHMLQ